MEQKKPLEVIGWLGSSGYRLVVDESARKSAEAAKKMKGATMPVIRVDAVARHYLAQYLRSFRRHCIASFDRGYLLGYAEGAGASDATFRQLWRIMY